MSDGLIYPNQITPSVKRSLPKPASLGHWGRPRTGNSGISQGLNFGNIVPGVSSVLGGLISSVQNIVNRRWSEKQAKVAYERQVEQWRRENAYNSPSAMVARLKAAGINVNDAFSGQGAQPAAGLSSVESASYNPMDVASSMSGMINSSTGVFNSRTQLMNAETSRSRVRVQNALDIENINHVRALVENTNMDTAYKQVILNYLDRSEALRLASMEAQIVLTSEQASFYNKQVDWYARDMVSKIRERGANARALEQSIAKMLQDIETSKAYEAMTEEQQKYIKAQAIVGMISQGLGALTGVASAATGMTGMLFGAAGRSVAPSFGATVVY